MSVMSSNMIAKRNTRDLQDSLGAGLKPGCWRGQEMQASTIVLIILMRSIYIYMYTYIYMVIPPGTPPPFMMPSLSFALWGLGSEPFQR